MAVDGYVYFLDYSGNYVQSESQVSLTATAATTNAATAGKATEDTMFSDFGFDAALKAGGLFEIDGFSFGIEQTLNIGSQSSGAGAGKVNFKEFTIERKMDKSSPLMFTMACSGTPFQDVRLGLRKAAGASGSGIIYLVYRFKLVAFKSIDWSNDEQAPKETMVFEYGGLQVHYSVQKPDGSLDKTYAGGWNRVANVRDDDKASAAIGGTASS